MKFNYKFYMVLSFVCFIVFIIMTRKGMDLRYVFLGFGLGAGIRSAYEFLKKEKQAP